MTRLLSFEWHLTHTRLLVSGGLRRFVEVALRAKVNDMFFTVVENSPSIKSAIGSLNYEPVEFRIPLDKYEDSLFIRLLLWIYYCVKATLVGLKQASRHRFNIVTTHSGELFCTAVPPFIIHALKRIPLSYVVQLAPPGLPSSGVASEYLKYRRRGFSFLKATGLSFYAYATRLFLVRIYNRAQLIIVVSESLKKQLENYGVERKIWVVKNGINVEEIEKVTYEGAKIYDAVFVGRHTPEKGIFDLLDVWKEVVKTIPKAVLVLIGYCTWDMRKLVNEMVNRYSLTNNILIKGVVPQSELVLTMKRSKLFLFLSQEESFALVVGEALACGIPVVCYNIPPVQEFYQARPVLRCRVGDKDCAAKKTLKLLLDEPLMRELGEESNACVQRFKWDETAREESEIIRSLVR